MIALNPVLQLSGLIAGVLANFKHGDDDDFDGNGLRLRCAVVGNGGEHDANEEESEAGHF
jgi:hypothetical protein